MKENFSVIFIHFDLSVDYLFEFLLIIIYSCIFSIREKLLMYLLRYHGYESSVCYFYERIDCYSHVLSSHRNEKHTREKMKRVLTIVEYEER